MTLSLVEGDFNSDGILDIFTPPTIWFGQVLPPGMTLVR